ncbi:amino acid/polyamine transporter I [Gorgonomyces haynaldii]|nr:amino acid/polyamine transporter I [Gorgonomyces haynaldii]
MTTFMNFSFSFTAVAAITSIISLFPTYITTGGPATMVWSWIGGSVLTLIVGCSLAEIGSRYPSAGSVYYWTQRMAPRNSQFIAFFCGWSNFLGNMAASSFFALTLANFINQALELGGIEELPTWQTVLVAIGFNAIFAIVNTIRVDYQGLVQNAAALWQILSTLAILVALAVTCPTKSMTGKTVDVFFGTYNNTGFDNMSYVSLIGLLFSLYSFTGYEASGHLGEETMGASKSVPEGILYTICATAVAGLALILSLLYASVTDIPSIMSQELGTFGIFRRCMSGNASMALTVIVLVNAFFSGMATMTITVRMLFALGRDGAFPFSDKIARVHPVTKVPNHAVLGTFISSSIILLLPLASTTAFSAVTSISTIGFQVSYAIPIFLRITTFRRQFVPSTFSLGAFAIPLGAISCLFLLSTSVLFFLPVTYPITVENFNWTVVVFAGAALIALGQWSVYTKQKYRLAEWK